MFFSIIVMVIIITWNIISSLVGQIALAKSNTFLTMNTDVSVKVQWKWFLLNSHCFCRFVDIYEHIYVQGTLLGPFAFLMAFNHHHHVSK